MPRPAGALRAKDVLAGVDFEVVVGETVALLGPTGAGKTTTIDVLEEFPAARHGRASVHLAPWVWVALSRSLGAWELYRMVRRAMLTTT